jgi:hypothetical protein
VTGADFDEAAFAVETRRFSVNRHDLKDVGQGAEVAGIPGVQRQIRRDGRSRDQQVERAASTCLAT